MYYDARFGIDPREVSTSIFDSITIVYSSGTLRLRPGQAAGYKTNPFDEESVWEFEKVQFDAATMWKRNPVESENHAFVIREANIIR